jgi:CBS domain containing-hemolysin-like protein
MMQRSPQAIAIVVDEFGGTAGLITLKDLIAQITGDNLKLDSANELPVQFIDAQTFIVQAQINLEDANDLLGLDLPLHEEYQTLGGFLLYQYQRIPAQGETLNFNNLELTVISASGSRLHEIRIYRPEPEPESPNIDGFEDLEAEPMPGDRKENIEGDRPN